MIQRTARGPARRAVAGALHLALAVVLALPMLPTAGPSGARAGSTGGFVTVEGDHFLLEGKPFVMKGFNYYPRDYGWSDLVGWDWAEVDRELALAGSVGSNVIRTGINFLHATGNTHATLPFEEHVGATPAYLDAIEHLLALIDAHGMKAILWVNDALPAEWWQPDHFGFVREHLESVLPRFADDPRIAAWDLFTDLDASMLQPPAQGGAFGELAWSTKANMLTLLRNEAGVFRRLVPRHLIGIGFSWPTSSLLAQDFTDFLMPQFLGGDHPELLARDSIGPAEVYADFAAAAGARSRVLDEATAKVRTLRKGLRRPMPIVLSEFGLPTTGGAGFTPTTQAAAYDVVCDVAFLRMGLAGAIAWALTDFTWPPKGDTHVPPGSPQATAVEQSFGAWDLAYRPKPAVAVVRRYFATAPTLAIQSAPLDLRLTFSRTFVPSRLDPRSRDNRVLAAAIDRIDWLAASGARLARLDVGRPAARRYLVDGFSGDEGPWGSQVKDFAWVEGVAATALVRYPFPAGTASITVRAHNQLARQTMTVSVDGVRVGRLAMGTGWATYRVSMPSRSPVAGRPYVLRARFSIPVGAGTVTFETGSNASGWKVIGRATPRDGLASASVVFGRAGAAVVRARWSGFGSYGAAVSAPLSLRIAAP
jgi:hypothetical protein